jgi:hypothetical protein
MITLRQYAPGEAIIRENEPGECAYIIEKGRAEITKERHGKPSHIAFLETGMTFGEMSMVDDLPRSATVTAAEETVVREVHRDHLYEILKSNPETSLKLLKGIFERLRIANTTIARLKEELKAAEAGRAEKVDKADRATREKGQAGSVVPEEPAVAEESAAEEGSAAEGSSHAMALSAAARPADGRIKAVRIEGLTPKATEAMSASPFTLGFLPVKIGRKTNDPMVQNHLEITDKDPLQISRHHVSILQEGGKVGVMDRGSQLGASVNGQRIGGKSDGPGPVFLEGDEGLLVLGTEKSPFRYKITIER